MHLLDTQVTLTVFSFLMENCYTTSGVTTGGAKLKMLLSPELLALCPFDVFSEAIES